MINSEDIAAVRERAPIDEIIGAHVALKPAGVGALKGLCPFHDERSPSFHVRPAQGRYHCFGCGEGGDVISFIMKLDGLSFQEAVEYLAPRAGITLRYEAGGGPRSEGTAGQRKRLLDAHRVAAEFYEAQLGSPEAKTARDFLLERGFGRDAAGQFGVGYAPQGWSHLSDHLRNNGFTEAELRASGLVSEGQSGKVYDRFRGRLIWPIRDVTGEVIGFGARRLYDDDQGPKYLNTPETPLYKKAQVLYGLDLAKTAIRQERQVVVVEGYTDVMACHLAGVTSAVATCGTAFGEDHVKVVRRLMGDVSGAQLKVGASASRVVFTFDGDEAGQNAALKSFALDQSFLAQTFVAVDPDGLDPCDLRQQRGDDAVRALIDGVQPLYQFVIRTALASFDLNTVEGRVAALRASAPVVAGIRDKALRPEYARQLAGWLGMDPEAVRAAVADAGKRGSGGAGPGASGGARPGGSGTRGGAPGPGDSGRGGPGGVRTGGSGVGGSGSGSGGYGRGQGRGVSGPPDDYAPPEDPYGVSAPANQDRPNPRDPVVRAEALCLGVLLQAAVELRGEPGGQALADELTPEAFSVSQYRRIFEAMQAAGGVREAGPDWVARVVEQAGETLEGAISGLAVTPLPHDRADTLGHYARSVVAKVVELGLTRDIAGLRGHMQRAGEGSAEAQEIFEQVLTLESRRRELREM